MSISLVSLMRLPHVLIACGAVSVPSSSTIGGSVLPDLTEPLRGVQDAFHALADSLGSMREALTILALERVLQSMQKPTPCFIAIVKICTELRYT